MGFLYRHAMIYEFPDPNDPIRQGDIFRSLPMVYLDPGNMTILDEDAEQPQEGVNWVTENITTAARVLTSVAPVYGIVVTQDCDAGRDVYITFFLIDEFSRIVKDVTLPPGNPDNPAWWGSDKFLRRARYAEKWFYLPADNQLGFERRMVASFQISFQVRMKFLLGNREQLRMGRLNQTAYDHFREKVAQYYRRYAYNEWYPLTQEEFSAYQKEYPDAEPFPWQQSGA